MIRSGVSVHNVFCHASLHFKFTFLEHNANHRPGWETAPVGLPIRPTSSDLQPGYEALKRFSIIVSDRAVILNCPFLSSQTDSLPAFNSTGGVLCPWVHFSLPVPSCKQKFGKVARSDAVLQIYDSIFVCQDYCSKQRWQWVWGTEYQLQ